MSKLLIIGHARHGKDTVAQMFKGKAGLTFKSSSVAASEIFLYEALREKYGYQSPEECFNDRVNHRSEWYDMICDFNKTDKSRLTKEILKHSDMYIGMRSNDEIDSCLAQGLFELIIAVYDCRKPLEPPDSFDIDLWGKSDIVIPNCGTLEELELKVDRIINKIC